MRLHNGPRHEEIRIKANYNIAARIRFSLTAVEIFNAKGKDIVIAQRFSVRWFWTTRKCHTSNLVKSLEYSLSDIVTTSILPITAAIIS